MLQMATAFLVARERMSIPLSTPRALTVSAVALAHMLTSQAARRKETAKTAPQANTNHQKGPMAASVAMQGLMGINLKQLQAAAASRV
jgi:hypothetical protein